jgi:integrase/recombinase XerD
MTEHVTTNANHVIQIAFEDFILSRQASLCSPATLDFYTRMLTPFLESLTDSKPTAQDVRRFLAGVASRGVSAGTVHAYARAVRAFLNFCYAEGYLDQPVKVDMPRVPQKRMEVLTPGEIKKVLAVCNVRDRAIVLVLIDSGLRRGELLGLTWDDIDFKTGAVLVRHGKGGKSRTTIIGVKSRRALLKWRRQSNPNGGPFDLTGSGLASVMDRISKRSGVKISCHKCRRTFATLALRAGMDVLSLQRMLGHSTLEMVRRYVTQVDADLLVVHRQHSPVETFLR